MTEQEIQQALDFKGVRDVKLTIDPRVRFPSLLSGVTEGIEPVFDQDYFKKKTANFMEAYIEGKTTALNVEELKDREMKRYERRERRQDRGY